MHKKLLRIIYDLQIEELKILKIKKRFNFKQLTFTDNIFSVIIFRNISISIIEIKSKWHFVSI